MTDQMIHALEALNAMSQPYANPAGRDQALQGVLRAFGDTGYYNNPDELRDRVLFHVVRAVHEARIAAALAMDAARLAAPPAPARWGPEGGVPFEFKTSGRD